MVDEIKVHYCKLLLIHSDIMDNHNSYLEGFDNFIKLGKNIKTNTLNIYLLKNSLEEISLYLKQFPKLLDKKKELNKHLDFMNHLRNLIAGHLDNKVIENAIQWEPSLFHIHAYNEKEGQLNLFYKSLIESALNSYIQEDCNHKIFSGEIDILYPPNQKELFDYLEKVNTLALSLIESILDEIKPAIKFVEGYEFIKTAFEAGHTDFSIKMKK